MARPIPSGTITFLFTDIEGSTRLWEQQGTEMKVELARHDDLLRTAIESHGGYVFKTVGDAFCAAFTTPIAALRAGLDAQRALAAEPWVVPGGIRVRMGLHTGTAQERDGDYFGPSLNRTARLFSIGAGGQILLSLATAELLRDSIPDTVGLKDLGAHRLKDLMRPESIFQVVAPGLRTDFPRLKSLDTHPNNLPLEPTPFIGRERDLEIASATLQGDACRVLTLTGVGGAGKTRFGLQLAANLTEQFPEGVYFVDLSAIDSPPFVVPAIARTLGLQLAGGRSARDVLADSLRDRRVLLILDNFEQVMAAVPHVVELLAACPGLKCIVTSREALHIRSENVLPVPPLSAPGVKAASDIGLKQLSQYESVSLFIDRARSVRPTFEVTNDTAPAVAEICARLDGLPLAIELAAARITTLSPHAILERLGNALKLLTGGAADLPHRQRTLRAAIDWSYRMLSGVEQTVFTELSVFSGGATLDAAEQVCNCRDEGVEVLEILSSLVDKSLVSRTEHAGRETRFQMLETMKEYAQELLSAEAAAEFRRHHARYFADSAEQRKAGTRGPRQRETFDWYEEEHDNLQSALDWVHEKEPVETEVRFCAALTPFYQARGFLTEGAANLERASVRIGDGLPALKAVIDLARAQVLGSLDRYHESLVLLDSVEADLRMTGDPGGLLLVEHERGQCWYRLGFQDRAIEHYRQVIAGASPGDTYLVSLAELGIGSSKCMSGDFDEARGFLERCRATFVQMGDDRSLARTLLSVLMISYQKEDFQEALRVCREVLLVQGRVKDHFSLLMGYNNMGCLLIRLEQFAEARDAYEKMLPVAERSSNRHFLAWGHAGLAEALLGLGNLESATDHAEHAVAIARAVDTPFDLGVGIRVLGEIHLRMGLYGKALEELKDSVPLIEQGGDRVEYRRAVKGLEKARILVAAASAADLR